MGDEYFMDFAGAGGAAERFRSRSAHFSGAATELMGASGIEDPLGTVLDRVLQAGRGVLLAYSDQLSVLSGLVDESVQVVNQVDVDLVI